MHTATLIHSIHTSSEAWGKFMYWSRVKYVFQTCRLPALMTYVSFT